MKHQLIMSVDVESVGLHGEGFAAGWAIYNTAAPERGVSLHCISAPMPVCKDKETATWLAEHLPLDRYGRIVALPHLHSYQQVKHPQEVRQFFWSAWLAIRHEGAGRTDIDARMLSDCGWPVEANFLSACVSDAPAGRSWQGPYPLLDLGSIIVAKGGDPLEVFARTDSELPEHHPTADALQSLRIYCEAMGYPVPRVQTDAPIVG